MRRFSLIFLCTAAAPAWAEEPAAPQAEEEEGRQVLEIPTEEGPERETPPITLRQLTPREAISLDEAVDMPDDI